jgi:hypothetical protein
MPKSSPAPTNQPAAAAFLKLGEPESEFAPSPGQTKLGISVGSVYFPSAACAAASRATGTRNGEQLT